MDKLYSNIQYSSDLSHFFNNNTRKRVDKEENNKHTYIKLIKKQDIRSHSTIRLSLNCEIKRVNCEILSLESHNCVKSCIWEVKHHNFRIFHSSYETISHISILLPRNCQIKCSNSEVKYHNSILLPHTCKIKHLIFEIVQLQDN